MPWELIPNLTDCFGVPHEYPGVSQYNYIERMIVLGVWSRLGSTPLKRRLGLVIGL